ncbi:MAG TPA: hypothetical protein VFH78_00600 [Candidatus Thermoplasmatota archaeon]|nr:hypothetical protein [Candidatus Thermoplasmatota archaeon]
MLSILLVSTLGAATPIVVPPAPETLVEGHTVFAILDIVSVVNVTEASFATAVAVLVREYRQEQRAQRFPGVLWFNDQYLVDPYQTVNKPRFGRAGDDGSTWRYPCGGAVLAVNAGDPDPRVAIARMNGSYPTHPALPDRFDGEVDKEYPRGSSYDGDYAWLDVEFNLTDPSSPYARAHTDSRSGARYEKSYTITDPNDHSWVIDKYVFYERDVLLGARGVRVYEYPVWVVNLLGGPVYVPDDPQLSCVPFADLLSGRVLGSYCDNADDVQGRDGLPLDCAQTRLNERQCRGRIPNGHDTGHARPGYLGSSPYVDEPCAGYGEPSRNGYCYGGTRNSTTTPCSDRSQYPLRTYNALLYFELHELHVVGAPRDHSDPYNSTDTNGCSSAAAPPTWTPEEWACPGGDDDAEGNSHPFHPLAPSHAHGASVCPDAFKGPNPTNHGGSTDPYARCDYTHATRNIDIYFGGRPPPPPTRRNAVNDNQGSGAPFHDYHRAYPPPP